MKRYVRSALVGLAVVGLAACGGNGDKRAEAASFASAVDGSDAFIGVVVDQAEDRVLAYVCDGTSTATWFSGASAEDGTLVLTGPDGARITGRIAGRALSGTVTLAGDPSPHAFAATSVSAPAGLYRARGEVRGQPAVGGWIVLPDGSQRGAVRTSSGFIDTNTDLAKPSKPVTSFTSTDIDF